MSYPKKHPTDQVSERDLKNQQRREQMRSLLINKFRGKYNVTPDNEKYDRLITSEVNNFLQNEQLTEINLIRLDKKIADIFGVTASANAHKKQGSITGEVKQLRANNNSVQQHQAKQSQDYNSNQSAVSSSKQSRRSEVSRSSITSSHRSKSSALQDVANQILATPSKQGDDYWNKIIMHNVESFHKEQEDAKQRAKDNQQRMKEELEQQIIIQRKIKEEEKRKEQQFAQELYNKSEEQKRLDQVKHDEIKRKLAVEKEVRDMQLKEHSLKKSEEQKIEKMQEEERRRRLEKEARDQQIKEKEKIIGYKMQCQQQRQENLAFKEIKKKQEEEQNVVINNDNMLGQLFIEKKHISYEKRAQNDRKVEMMKDKLIGDQLKREQQMSKSIDQVQLERQRIEKIQEDKKKKEMKAKEIATKEYLDLQIQEKLQRNQLSKVTEEQEAKYIHKDVEVFEITEKQKKEGVQIAMKSHKESLEKQMQASKTKNSTMAQHEYMLNKKILDTIESKGNNNDTIATRKPF